MRTVHTVLKRGGLYWDRELLPPEACAVRYARVQAAIAAAGDDAWLVYGDVGCQGALAYVSHFLVRVRAGAVLIPRAGAPVLFAAIGLRDVPAAKTLTWIEEVRPFSRLVPALTSLIEERQLTRARIGVVGVEDLMPGADWEALRRSLPEVSWPERTPSLAALRAAKEAPEIAAIEHAAGSIAAALDAVPRFLRPGMTEREAAARIDRVIRRAAAEDVRILIASGKQAGLGLGPVGDRALRAGDALLLFVAAAHQRYWAEAARSYVLGPVPEAMRDLAQRAGAAMAAMRGATVAGGAVAAIWRAAEAALGPVLLPLAASYGIGHGIGLDSEEAPSIVASSDGELRADATLSLHLVLHADGQGVALGQTVIARPGSCESLGDAPPPVECRGG